MQKKIAIAGVCILFAVLTGFRLAGTSEVSAKTAGHNTVPTQVEMVQEKQPEDSSVGYKVVGKLSLSVNGATPHSEAPPDKIFDLAEKAQAEAAKAKEEKK